MLEANRKPVAWNPLNAEASMLHQSVQRTLRLCLQEARQDRSSVTKTLQPFSTTPWHTRDTNMAIWLLMVCEVFQVQDKDFACLSVRESALAKASLWLFWLSHTKSSQTHGVISKGGKKISRQSKCRTKHSGWRSPWQNFSSAGQCCCHQHNALF